MGSDARPGVQTQTNRKEGMQITSDWKRGVFNVTTYNKETADFLSNFKLGVTHDGKTIEVPLRSKRNSRPGTWVRFYNTCIGKKGGTAKFVFRRRFGERRM
jgi:hypothetical protein